MMVASHALIVECPHCQARQSVQAIESANIDRCPRYRDDVLAGRFMRFACDRCGAAFPVERDLLYVHLSAGLFVAVFPSGQRARAEELEDAIDRVFGAAALPAAVRPARAAAAQIHHRVVFGYDELREKVLCWARGVDDVALELLKLELLLRYPERYPGWYRDGSAGLLLVEADDASLTFREVFEPARPAPGQHTVARAAYDRVASQRSDWIGATAPWLSRPYMNLRRAAGARAFAGPAVQARAAGPAA